MAQITRGGQIVETITFPINKTSDDFRKLIQQKNGYEVEVEKQPAANAKSQQNPRQTPSHATLFLCPSDQTWDRKSHQKDV
jgi:hypothetical protein